MRESGQLDMMSLMQVERLYSLGRLTAGIVHELNNPLNAILMNAELGLLLLEQQGRNDDKLAKVLQLIAQEARRGGTITQQLQNLVWADDFSPTEPAGDLNAAVTATRGLVGSNLRRNKVTLNLSLQHELPRLALNPPAITLAVANLLNNAIEAGASEVRIVSAIKENRLQLSVIDNGSALPKEDINSLLSDYTPFKTQAGRSLLGLALVQRIAKDHHGELVVARDFQESNQLMISLPLDASQR
ncbi:MAG: histidine kinase dimerization/phospho-acceptor domain-containing protein [Candidatus Competibacteraceae bacterium]